MRPKARGLLTTSIKRGPVHAYRIGTFRTKRKCTNAFRAKRKCMCAQIVQESRTFPAKIQSNAAVTEGQARKSAHSGRIISSMCALSCSKKALPYRDNSSAGLRSRGAHSIHTIHLSTMHMVCQAVDRVWMSLDLLQPFQPFVKAQQTFWLSMKRIISRPPTSAANVFRTPADAKVPGG